MPSRRRSRRADKFREKPTHNTTRCEKQANPRPIMQSVTVVEYPAREQESVLELLLRLHLGPDLIKQLQKLARPDEQKAQKSLGALRLVSRDCRNAVDESVTEVLLGCRGKVYDPLYRAAPAPTAQHMSQWPALLARLPRCTTARIRLPQFRSPGFLFAPRMTARQASLDLLEPFATAAARACTTARITRLGLDLGWSTYHDDGRSPPGGSYAELLDRAFPSVTELHLEGVDRDGTFAPRLYGGLAQHLSRLTRLTMDVFDGFTHVHLLARGLTNLRELTLELEDGFPGDIEVTHDQATALATFPQLRVLRFNGVYRYEFQNLRAALRGGLAPTLERVEFNYEDGVDLVLRSSPAEQQLGMAIGGGSSGTACGGQAGGSCRGSGSVAGSTERMATAAAAARRVWSVTAGEQCRVPGGGAWGDRSASAVAAVAEDLAVGRVELLQANPGVANSRLLPNCQQQHQLVVGTLHLRGDRDVQRLGEALQRLGSPEAVNAEGLRHPTPLAALSGAHATLLAPRLRRLAFRRCAGLTPAGLVAALDALPRCGEVQLHDCARLSSVAQYGRLAARLLAVPEGSSLRDARRLVRIHVGGWVRRPLEHSPDGGDDEEENHHSNCDREHARAQELQEEEEAEEEEEESVTAATGARRVQGSAGAAAARAVRDLVRRVVGSIAFEELNRALERGGVSVRLAVAPRLSQLRGEGGFTCQR